MSHCWTSALDHHLDHRFIIFKNVKHRTRLRRIHVWGNIIDVAQFKMFVLNWSLNLVLGLFSWWCVMRQVSLYILFGFLELVGRRMQHFKNQIQRSRAAIPSIREPASGEIISASVELWETEVCFLHIQLMGRNVWVPNMHKILPWGWLWVFKTSCRVRVLKQSWSALLCCMYYPHDNIVCIHMCDECLKSIDSGVCHRLWSIS